MLDEAKINISESDNLEGFMNVFSKRDDLQPGDPNFYTLDEPIEQTINIRKLTVMFTFAFLILFLMLIFATFSPEKKGDLWGPLFLCTFIAILLQSSGSANHNTDHDGGPQFSEVFTIVWIGSAIVTINSQLLGGKLSFFQSVCVLGYCLLPPAIALFFCKIILMIQQTKFLFFVRFSITMFNFLWATFDRERERKFEVEEQKREIVCEQMNLNELVARELQENEHTNKLDLSFRNLTNLSENVFFNLPNITNLQLNNNKLTNELKTIGCLKNLKILNLGFNDIKKISSSDFRDLRMLTKLILESNNLIFISPKAFSNLRHLTILNLRNTKIGLLKPPIFNQNVNLKTLCLENTNLVLGRNLFRKCTNLIELDLSGNDLKKFENNTFNSLRKLKILYMARNRLVELKSGLFTNNVKLKHLDLSLNNVERIDTDFFQPLISLLSVHLHGCSSSLHIENNIFENNILLNFITFSQCLSFPVNQIANLRGFYYDSNNTNNISISARNLMPFVFFENDCLDYLKISQFNLTTANIQMICTNFRFLTELHLTDNRFPDGLTNLMFRYLILLEILIFDRTKIFDFSRTVFDDGSKLIHLSLSKCSICKLTANAFKNLIYLTKLNLSRNLFVRGLNKNVFVYLKSLKYLDLSGSGLPSLPFEIFHRNRSLVKLKLEHNCLARLNLEMFAALEHFSELTYWNYTVLDGNIDERVHLRPIEMSDSNFH